MGTNAELLEKFASGFRPATAHEEPETPMPELVHQVQEKKPESLFRSTVSGRKLRVEIFDGLRFCAGELPDHAKKPVLFDLKRLAVFKNPAFGMAKLRGLPAPAEFHIAYEEALDGDMVFPKGDLRAVLDLFHLHKVPVDFIDRTTGGLPVGKEILVSGNLSDRLFPVFSLLSGKRHGLLIGGGGEAEDKKIASHLIAFHGFRTLIVVKQKWQLHAWEKALLENTNLQKADIGMVGAGRCELDRIVIIGIDRSLYQHVGVLRETVGFLIVDQCDVVNVKIFYGLVWKIPARFLLGVASSSKRRDGLTGMMRLFLGRAEGIIPGKEGIVVAAKEVLIGRLAGSVSGDNYDDVMANLCDDHDRTVSIFGTILAMVADGLRVIVVGPRIAQLTEISDLLQQNLRDAAVVTGQTPEKEMADVCSRFADGSLPVVLCTTKTLGGLSISPADAAVVAGPFRAMETAVQLDARVRPGGWICEYADNHPLLNGMLSARLGFYRKLSMRVRPSIPVDRLP